jgi:hypothetical protein
MVAKAGLRQLAQGLPGDCLILSRQSLFQPTE